MSVNVREHMPSEPLLPYVQSFWRANFNIAQAGLLKQKVIPNGYVELIVHLSDTHCELNKKSEWDSSPDYTLIGVYQDPYEVHFRTLVRVFGIRFKPEGFYTIFGQPASEFSGTYQDGALVVGKDFEDFCHRLRELTSEIEMIRHASEYLLGQLARNSGEPDYVNRAANLIRMRRGNIRIDELAKNAFISVRQLERGFREKIGMTPKRYLQLARLNEVNRLLDSGRELDFTEITYHCGYADQAHFIRDFKKFTGKTPGIFVRNRHRFIVNGHEEAAESSA